jgi:hypothetical protein
MVQGNTITDEIVQVNLKVVEWGKTVIFEEKAEEEVTEEKEFRFPIKMG